MKLGTVRTVITVITFCGGGGGGIFVFEIHTALELHAASSALARHLCDLCRFL